jgi:hypothetical protein
LTNAGNLDESTIGALLEEALERVDTDQQTKMMLKMLRMKRKMKRKKTMTKKKKFLPLPLQHHPFL